MQIEGPFVVFTLFVLRLALPLALLLGLGYLYERYVQRHQQSRRVELRSAARPTPLIDLKPAPGYAAQRVPCWEFKKCTPEQMAQCPVPQRPNVPCWLTKQLVQGQLPDQCIDCQIFKEGSHTQAHPAL
jgi:hypothetical protein